MNRSVWWRAAAMLAPLLLAACMVMPEVPVAGQMLGSVPANAATPPPDTPPPRY